MASDYLATPKPPPPLNIPDSKNTVKVSCIDSTSRFRIPASPFLQPDYAGQPYLQGPSFSFLIEHPSRKPILFDLGIRKDWHVLPSYPRWVREKWEISVEKDVATILREHGVDVAGGAVESIVWSHHHWDHVGDASTFPPSTELVVGPGFTAAHLPGYPDNAHATLLASDFAGGRRVRELDIQRAGRGLKLGRFHALDYFGDGSFYLLDTPGHTVGHMCALARTTAADPPTFVFMGGDAAHHGGEIRPTEYQPLPRELALPAREQPLRDGSGSGSGRPRRAPVCPGHLFQDVHPRAAPDQPFYHVTAFMSHDKRDADWTLAGCAEFDAHDNVLLLTAHDHDAVDPAQLDFYPLPLTDWYSKGAADKMRWLFLRDFEPALDAKEKGDAPWTWGEYS